MISLLNFSGVLAPIWLLIGVIYVGRLRPGYSHYSQFMSELGERGSSTQRISPCVNNFPIGVLFFLFGVYIYLAFSHSLLAITSSALIAVHGVGHIFAGVFPCDPGCRDLKGSRSQKLHNIFGNIMFFSILAASVLWYFVPAAELDHTWFGPYSLATAIIGFLFQGLMVWAIVAKRGGEGLYQRLSFGVFAVWVFVFAVMQLLP